MAITTRELYLILRARDEASRVVRNMAGSIRSLDRETQEAARRQIRRGQAMMTIGIGVAGAGVVGARALNDMTNAAAEYNTLAAQTLTQTDNVKTSVAELAEIGIRVGRDIPVPLTALQETLKFVFSSIDVSVVESEALLRGFAKEAVTGQGDIQAAARTSIALLNAYQLPVSELTRLQDVQFQIIRKGVITYDELSNNIGKAIPAAARAGQNFETLGAMMSFMTRNGLSAAMASTSAARALETIAHPKVVGKLEAIGVKVKDAHGEFRPLVDILGQVNDRFKDMTAPERAAALQELLVGGGNRIQARRFWDLALKNFDDFEQHVGWMENSQGVFDQAYDTMFQAPQSQIQLMQNKYEAMRLEIGDRLLPMKLQLVQAISKLLDMWANLSPRAKDLIAKFAALAAGIAIVVGVVAFVAGLFLVMQGAATLAGIALGTVAAVGAGVVVAIIAVIAIVVLLVKNWDKVKEVTLRVWNAVKDAVVAAWQKMVEWFNKGVAVAKDVGNWFAMVGEKIAAAWDVVWGAIGPTVMKIVGLIQDAGVAVAEWASSLAGELLPKIADAWNSLTDAVGDAVGKLVDFFGPFAKEVGDFISKVVDALLPRLIEGWNTLKDGFLRAWAAIQPALNGFGASMGKLVDIIAMIVEFGWNNLLKPALETMARIFTWLFGIIAKGVGFAFNILSEVIIGFVQTIWYGLLRPVLGAMGATFGLVWNTIAVVVGEAVAFIGGLIGTFIELIKGIIDFVYAVFTGDWKAAWQAAKDIVGTIVDGIIQLVVGLPEAIFNIISGLVEGVINFFKDLWHNLVGGSIIPDMIGEIVSWFGGLPGKLISAIAGLPDKLFVKAAEFMLSLNRGAKEIWDNTIWPFIKSLPGKFGDGIGELPKLLHRKGREAFGKLRAGAKEFWDKVVWPYIKSLPGEFVKGLTNLPGLLFDMGKNALKSLGEGIANVAGDVAEGAKNAVGNVVSGIGDFLGIGSPSRVFMQIGSFVMQGMESGITKGTAELARVAVNAVKHFDSSFRKGIEKSVLSTDRMLKQMPAMAKRSLSAFTGVVIREYTNMGQQIQKSVSSIGKNVDSTFKQIPVQVRKSVVAMSRAVVRDHDMMAKQITRSLGSLTRDALANVRQLTLVVTRQFRTGMTQSLIANRQGMARVVSEYQQLPRRVMNALRSMPDDHRRLGARSFNMLRGGMNDSWRGFVLPFVRSIPGQVRDRGFGDQRRVLVVRGKQLIDGLRSGMASRLASPGSWFRSIGNRIVQGVKSYFGIKSPSKVFAGLGGNLIQGFIKGMISSGANIPKVINRVFGSMPKALGALVDKGKISFGDLSGKAMNTLFDMGAAIGPGGFGFPLARGSFRVGSPFGMRNGKMHTGQDFPASIGTPVFSPISGYFNPVDLGNRSYGKYANVMAGAWRFIGAHLSAFARGPGGVRIGELLGFVGSTGNSTGPHLHAEMRYNGRAMDPRKIWSYAKGGMARAGQFAWAGEHGRELLYFARDARVFNAQESEQLVAGAAGGKTVNQYITVNTQEINPRKHAADLGWELATRT